jgi:hypothetical protein
MIRISIVVLNLALWHLPVHAQYIVAPGGNDSNNCISVLTPCATGQGAIEKVPMGGRGYVIFQPGVYDGMINNYYYRAISISGPPIRMAPATTLVPSHSSAVPPAPFCSPRTMRSAFMIVLLSATVRRALAQSHRVNTLLPTMAIFDSTERRRTTSWRAIHRRSIAAGSMR